MMFVYTAGLKAVHAAEVHIHVGIVGQRAALGCQSKCTVIINDDYVDDNDDDGTSHKFYWHALQFYCTLS